MTMEEKIELYNRAIGYRECLLDILYSGEFHGKVLDDIMCICKRYSLKDLGEADYSLKAIDEVLENE